MNNQLDYSRDPYFVSNPYLQSKKVYEDIIGANSLIDESTNNKPIIPNNNPFSIYYRE